MSKTKLTLAFDNKYHTFTRDTIFIHSCSAQSHTDHDSTDCICKLLGLHIMVISTEKSMSGRRYAKVIFEGKEYLLLKENFWTKGQLGTIENNPGFEKLLINKNNATWGIKKAGT